MVTLLKSIPSQLHTLWELIILGEPLLVIGHSPTLTSAMVQLLVGMAWPLRYTADYRPYFTIHDGDFAELSGGGNELTQKVSKIRLVGVTNPFFSKALKNWPNVLRLGRGEPLANAKPLKGAMKALKFQSATGQPVVGKQHSHKHLGLTAVYKSVLHMGKECRLELVRRMSEAGCFRYAWNGLLAVSIVMLNYFR